MFERCLGCFFNKALLKEGLMDIFGLHFYELFKVQSRSTSDTPLIKRIREISQICKYSMLEESGT